MGSKISGLPKKELLDGNEILPVADNGLNKRITLSDLKKYVKPTSNELGLDKVDNTSDHDKPLSNAAQVALANKANAIHIHDIDNVHDLREQLNAKAVIGHTHNAENIIGLLELLASKSNLVHSHIITDITGLNNVTSITDVPGLEQALAELNLALSNLSTLIATKANRLHTHFISDINELESTLDNKADKNHNHSIAAITGLTTALAERPTEISVAERLGVKSDIGHKHVSTDITDLIVPNVLYVREEW